MNKIRLLIMIVLLCAVAISTTVTVTTTAYAQTVPGCVPKVPEIRCTCDTRCITCQPGRLIKQCITGRIYYCALKGDKCKCAAPDWYNCSACGNCPQ
jgi:hypothetical protein